MPNDPYVDPGTDVLRNRFDVRDPLELARRERNITSLRLAELGHGGCPEPTISPTYGHSTTTSSTSSTPGRGSCGQ